MICSEQIFLCILWLNAQFLSSLGSFRVFCWLRTTIRDINHVQNRQNLHLCDTLYTLVEAIEGREDHIDELICGVSVLQTPSNAIRVHLSHESFELFAVKDLICVHVGGSECRINFGHESLQSFWIRPKCLLEFDASCPFLLSEGCFPSCFVGFERSQKGLDSVLFHLLDLFWGRCLNHI